MLYALVITVIGWIGKLDLSDQLELWTGALIGLGLLALGLVVGLGLRHGSQLPSGLDGESQDIETYRALKRTDAYVAHFMNVLDALLGEEMKLEGLASDERDETLSSGLCELPRELIKESTGLDVGVSLLIEGQNKEDKPKFVVAFDVGHSIKQVHKFEKLKVQETWLHQNTQPGSYRSPVAHIGLDTSDKRPDLDFFRSMGYKSVCAFAVDVDGVTARLVMLLKEVSEPAQPEVLFMLLMWCVLTIAAGRDPAAKSKAVALVEAVKAPLSEPIETSSANGEGNQHTAPERASD